MTLIKERVHKYSGSNRNNFINISVSLCIHSLSLLARNYLDLLPLDDNHITQIPAI